MPSPTSSTDNVPVIITEMSWLQLPINYTLSIQERGTLVRRFYDWDARLVKVPPDLAKELVDKGYALEIDDHRCERCGALGYGFKHRCHPKKL